MNVWVIFSQMSNYSFTAPAPKPLAGTIDFDLFDSVL